MKSSLSLVTLGTRDLARSRAFYRTLGWQESPASKEAIAFFQLGALALALYDREALAEDAGVAAEGSGFGGITLAHNVASEAEVAPLLAEAVAAGGSLKQPAEKVFWGGVRGYFADPDGHLWEVCWNPFWPLTAQGHVVLPAP